MDMETALKVVIGNSKPDVVNHYRRKLRSSGSRPLSNRTLPSILRVIVTPGSNDEQTALRLNAEGLSDLAVMKWETIEASIGKDLAAALRQKVPS